MSIYYTTDKITYSTMDELLASSGIAGLRADSLDHPGSNMYYNTSVSKWGGNLGSGWYTDGVTSPQLPTTVAYGTRALCDAALTEYTYNISTGWSASPIRYPTSVQDVDADSAISFRYRCWGNNAIFLEEDWLPAGATASPPSLPASINGGISSDSNVLTLTYTNMRGGTQGSHPNVGGDPNNLDAVAMYYPSDGYTWLSVVIDPAYLGYGLSLKLYKTDDSTLTIYWGNGSSTAYTNKGNFTAAKYYAAAGSYGVRMAITSGSGTYNFGYGTTGNKFDVYNQIDRIWLSNSITSIRDYAFQNHTSLRYIVGNSVTSIGSYAFYGAVNLKIAALCNATTINTYAFYQCTRLLCATFPYATTIGDQAFRLCSRMETIYAPLATSVGQYALYVCSALTSARLDAITTLMDYCLGNTYQLHSIYLDSCTTVNAQAFQGSGVGVIYLPNTSLSVIRASAFAYASRLRKVYLEATTPPTLVDSNAFTGTFGNFTGQTITVPSASVTTYQGATNWSTYASWITGA